MKSLLAIGLILGLSQTALAQSTSISIDNQSSDKVVPEERLQLDKKDKKSSGGEGVEKIRVTGSHIKRINIEGPSPVQILDRKDLDKTGYNSVADVLRDTTSNSFGSLREDSGSNAAGVAHVSLRGLGSSSTLVLLNGQRLPSDAVTGAVDLNLIPMAAVERIEILKDGASALYGSDALGGVVNIITRKDVTGSEVSFKQSQPELDGGKKTEISLVNGINKGKLNMVNVIYYRDNEKIFSRDREWTNTGVSTLGSPGAHRPVGGTWTADANCPADQILTTPGGTFCTFKYSDFSTELPALEQMSVMSEATIQATANTKLKARMGGTRKLSGWTYAPAPGIFDIPADVADTLGDGGGPLPGVPLGSDVEARYRLTELGNRESEITTEAYNLLLGGTTEVGDSWEIEFTTSYNRVDRKDVGISGYALTPTLLNLIATGKFNPFAPEGQRGEINSAKYQPIEETRSEVSTAQIMASGEIGEIKSGPIGMAVGVTFTNQAYEDKFDAMSVAGQVFGNAGSSGGGQRDTKAVFTEFSIPLTQKLEMQMAGRYDKYSDFGDTFNPKIAFRYQATNKLLLRASAGSGFKAPLMQNLYAATSLGYPTFIDAVACDAEKKAGGPTPACTPQQYEVTSGGNTGLKEEKSISYNVGALFQPSRDFNIGSDVWVTQMSNVVGISYADAMEAELKGIDLSEHGVIVKRDANGYLDNIEAPLQNLSSQEVMGIDFSMGYRLGKFKLGVDHSHLFFYRQEGFPGAGFENILGENGVPPWKTSYSLGFSPNHQHEAIFLANAIGFQEKAVKGNGNLPTYTTFDFQYNFKSRKWGIVTLGVKNLAGSTPPLDETNPNSQLNTSLYDQIGRQVYTAYKATF